MNWPFFWTSVFTPLSVAIASLVIWFSHRSQKTGKIKTALVTLCLSALILRAASSTYFSLAPWDERYHAVVAAHMMSEPFKPTLYRDAVMPYDVRAWTGNHIWLHKPPLTMALMAASMKLFGKKEFAVRIPSIVLTSIEPLLIALLVTAFFGSTAGWFAGFLNAINGYLIELASGRVATDHTDALMTFWVLLSIVVGVRACAKKEFRGGVFSGLAMAASILTKWWTGLIALPVVFLYTWGDRGARAAIQRASAMLFTALTIVMPWEHFVRAHYPDEVRATTREHFAHFTDSLAGGPAGEYWLHFKNMPKIYGVMIIVAFFVFIAHSIRTRGVRSRFLKEASIVLWWLVPYIVFSIAETKMSGLVMISSGALFLMSAFFYERLKVWKFENREKRFLAALGVLATILVWAAPIQYSLERMKVFKHHDRFPVSAYRLRVLNCRLPPEQKTVIFNLPELIEAMFYTPHSAYGYLPKEADVADLKSRGYRVIAISDSKASIETRPDLEWISLPETLPQGLTETLIPCSQVFADTATK